MSKYFLHSKGEGDKYKVYRFTFKNENLLSVVFVSFDWDRFFSCLHTDYTFVFIPQFFMKATQLDQMREDFVYIKTTKHVTEDKVEQHSEVRISLPDMFIFKVAVTDILKNKGSLLT